MILSRYSSIDYIMQLPFDDGFKLILKARGKETEERAWDMWLGHYNNPYAKNKMDWNTFICKMKNKPLETKLELSKEDIIAKAEEIKLRHFKI